MEAQSYPRKNLRKQGVKIETAGTEVERGFWEEKSKKVAKIVHHPWGPQTSYTLSLEATSEETKLIKVCISGSRSTTHFVSLSGLRVVVLQS